MAVDTSALSRAAFSEPSRRRTLRGRIMRVLAPVTIGVFLVAGLVAAAYFVQAARADLQERQQRALNQFSSAVTSYVSESVALAQGVAESASVQRFATALAEGEAPDTTDVALNSMVDGFQNLVERYYPELLAASFVTNSGSIWGRAEIWPDGTVGRSRDAVVNALEDDPVALAALDAPPGQAVARPIELKSDPTTPDFDVAPYIRLFMPVALEAGTATNSGLVAIDLRAGVLLDELERIQQSNEAVLGDTRMLILDNAGHVLFDSTDPDMVDLIAPTNMASQTFPSINRVLGDQESLLLSPAGQDVISSSSIRFPGRDDVYMRLVAVNDLVLLQEAGTLDAIVVLGGALISGIVLSLITWWLLGRFTRPAQRFADEIATGAPVSLVEAASEGGDEVGYVMAAYAALRDENERLAADLDARTQRYTRSFDIISSVSSQAAAQSSLDDLLNRTIDQICRSYDFYHAQVFLLDDVGKDAVLVYSFGEAGRRLLERRHRLAVGSPSLVGQAAELDRPMIVNDTSDPGDAPWRFNPLLPDTRSEMAYPLRLGGHIIGVLDLQSTHQNAFLDEDMQSYRLLTDQMAIAINNARLLQQSQERIEQIDLLNRQLTRTAWEETTSRVTGQAYVYDLMQVQTAEAAPSAPSEATGKDIPIAIRGEVVGNLSAGGEQFSNEDEALLRAVADRVAIALENARLFEQTETALSETRRLYTATRAITSAANPNAVYSAAAEHLTSAAPATSRLSVLLCAPTQTKDAPYYELGYLWTREEGSEANANLRLAASTFPLVSMVEQAGGLFLVKSSADASAEPALQALLGQHATQSALLAPVRTRQRWFGFVLIESDYPTVYDEDFGRFAAAVADQMGIALEGQTLFDEAQDQAQRAFALAEAGQLASRVGAEFTDSLGGVFERIAEVAHYDRWELLLLDESGERLLSVLSRFSDETAPPSEPLKIDADAPLAAVFRENRPLLINDPVGFPLYAGLTLYDIELLGKHILYPVRAGEGSVGVLSIGRSLDEADLDERDEQLVVTLAAQIGIAVENRRLFLTAEGERQTLRTILETLPAGVLVLDPVTFKPLQANQQAQQLLGPAVTNDEPFNIEAFGIVRAGSGAPYPAEDLPIFAAARRKEQIASDDITIRRPDGEESALLVNAAPLIDAQGNITAIVAAFEDITPLRNLENSLQVNLRDTVVLYEATRALAEAPETEDVLDQVIMQLSLDEPSEIFVLLLDEEGGGARVARSLSGHRGVFPLPSELLTQNSYIVEDLPRARLGAGTKSALTTAGVQAFCSTPLRARSRRDVPLGWLVITWDHPFNVHAREQFISTLAESASVALDNRALFASTQIALQETAALYNATTGISASRDAMALTDALKSSLEQMQPDVYAAVLVSDGTPVNLFSQNMDGAPVDFGHLVVETAALQGPSSVFLDDLRSITEPSAFEQAVAGLGTVRALGMVHLRAQGKPAGALIVGYHQPHRFGAGDVRYLSAVADSASVVADNILLLDQIQANLQETSVLYEATRALANARTPADVIDIVRNYLSGGRFSQAFIAQLNRGDWSNPQATATIVAGWTAESDMTLEGVTLTPEQFPAWSLLATPDVLVVPDAQTDSRIGPMEALGLETMDMRAVAILPLRSAGHAIGALVLGSREPVEFADSDSRVFSSFTEQAGLRLEASRLVQQTERRARQLATSAQVSSIAGSILDLSFLLPRLVESIRTQFGYDHVQIFLMDDQDEFAVLRASTGDAGRQLLEANHKLQRGSQSVIGQVTATGKPVIATDTADARVVHRPNPLLPNTRSEMAIPLILKGQVVGALDVQSNQPDTFDDDDVAILTTLAAQVSVAIDNAQLFEQSSQRASEMTFLFGVTNAAASSDNLTEALDNVAAELVNSLDALAAVVYLPYTLVDGVGGEHTLLRAVAWSGAVASSDDLPDVALDSDELLAQAGRERAPLIIDSLAEVAQYTPIARAARSAILVPLASGAKLAGIMLVESDVQNAFGPQALTLMLTLSGSLAAIVQSQMLLQQLQQTNEQLRELDRLKSDFLANMSHELRTPLNSIIGFSKVILKGIDGPLTEMQEQDLSTIYNSGIHLLNLINDILDQAKIAAGKMDLHFDFFEMKSVVDAVRSIGLGLVKDKPISIHVEIGPGLPKAYGDELRTRQVLINLVSNAAKFTREGAITIRSYKVRDPGTGRDMVRTDVIDTGIGIAESDIPLLFEAFRQVDSSLTRTVGGTGLGLPIAKSLIEMMGGAMEVESVLNVGSTFSVILPVTPSEDTLDQEPDAPQVVLAPVSGNGNGNGVGYDTEILPRPAVRKKQTAEMQSPAIGPGGSPLTKRQVLLIEDNPDMVDQYRRLLQREGYDVFVASIPLEAEAMASGLHPTAIIMEASFADGASWDILGRLKGRDDTGDIPVIIVSLADVARQAVDGGAFRTLRRPFSPETLVQAVNEAERDSRTERILIIDDQPESVRLLTEMLNEQGRYRVFSAASGTEGIALVARRRPDLILVDLRMPGMNGFEVIEELRSNPETLATPILVVTSEALSPDEMHRLQDVHVLYKSDLMAGIRREFLDEVRARLTNPAAG